MSCLLLTESSHDMLESSRYIPRDRSHMRTKEINMNFGRRYGSKKDWQLLKAYCLYSRKMLLDVSFLSVG